MSNPGAAAEDDRNWGLFKIIPREGRKPEKQPVDLATGKFPAPPDKAFQYTLAEARNAMQPDAVLGYLPRFGSLYVGLDMDDCLDAEQRVVDWADEILGDTMVPDAVTASGKGLRLMMPRSPGDEGHSSHESAGVGIFANDRKAFTVPEELADKLPDLPRDENVVNRLLARLKQPSIVLENDETREQKFADKNTKWEKHWLHKLSPEDQQEAVRRMLACVPHMAVEYSDWFSITAALHDLSRRVRWSVESVWDEWCQTVFGGADPANFLQYKGYDAEQNQYIWDRLKPDDGGRISVFTLVHHARAAGFDPKPWETKASEAEAKRYAEAMAEMKGRWQEAKQEADGGPKANRKPGEGVGTSIADMMAQTPTPTEWFWRDMLCPGLALWEGGAKTGKSYMVLQVAEALSLGKPLWGLETARVPVLLYSAELEYDETLERVHTMQLDGSGDLILRCRGRDFEVDPARTVEQFMLELMEVLAQEPSVRVVIVDTFRFMAPAKPAVEGNAQDADFAYWMPVQIFARKTNICIVAVEHTNKPSDGRSGLREQAIASAGSMLKSATAQCHITAQALIDKETKGQTGEVVVQRKMRSARNATPNIHVRWAEGSRFETLTEGMQAFSRLLDKSRANSIERQILKALKEAVDGEMTYEELQAVIRTPSGKASGKNGTGQFYRVAGDLNDRGVVEKIVRGGSTVLRLSHAFREG